MQSLIGNDRRGALIRVTLNSEHYHVNKGKGFKAHLGDPVLGNGATLIVAFKTPNESEKVHLTVIADSTGVSKLEILEGPTVTNGSGTMVDWKNRKRGSPIKSGTFSIEASPWAGQYNEDPAITADGEVLDTHYMGAGVNKHSGQKWELEKDTVYAVRLTSGEASNIANLILLQHETEDY